MARFIRASLLLTALGVALLVLPASAAAANGGAAPTSTAVSASASSGGAAPGAEPVEALSAAHSGGAVPGQKPHRAAVRRKPKPKRTAKPKRHAAKPKPKAKPVDPSQPVAPAPAGPTVAGIFPLAGTYSFGAEDARFGAGRTGHIHQGQDVIAASGTPIVAPIAGAVLWEANQPAGAGIYAVLHGENARDYVFMHIKHDTLLVKTGDAVSAGQQIAQVGATGDATGPHLHFEIWVGGWGTKVAQPIDPLPQLQRWASGGA